MEQTARAPRTLLIIRGREGYINGCVRQSLPRALLRIRGHELLLAENKTDDKKTFLQNYTTPLRFLQ
ncbi:hypothetical protein NDU88_008271 [Pleurodeles waltl]|uniref:Uncharacterized protein n=1 Tax=Pleurodeles waltl TaxID=8319 RepID=A0AAV7PSE0_PLEWA|nr:hypothetical protein NDU88_008271 [Pleurodeles waltl]